MIFIGKPAGRQLAVTTTTATTIGLHQLLSTYVFWTLDNRLVQQEETTLGNWAMIGTI